MDPRKYRVNTNLHQRLNDQIALLNILSYSTSFVGSSPKVGDYFSPSVPLLCFSFDSIETDAQYDRVLSSLNKTNIC
jgi:hypothetical protein